MRVERFQRLEELFHRLVELDSASRRDLLEDECADAPELRAELEAMLLSDQEMGDPSGPPAVSQVATDPLDRKGAAVGPYLTRRLVARGGMGVVYEAEQQEPIQRTVALKLIRAGLDSRQVVARFEMERQALALMDHPHVARVYDAGVTDDGRPYFAMEWVDGIPITEYCLRNELGLRARLELFADVCDAVQHAHQKGLIHRDLKPSNVLVDASSGRPVPKVIDFGVAKAVDERYGLSSDQTRAGDLVGTPEYMSPEQAEAGNRDVDTRSDVYSLGVMLYELLTGAHPYRDDGEGSTQVAEMLQRVRSETPLRPSYRLQSGPTGTESATGLRLDLHSAVRRLKGDLDWIVLRAMEKEKSQRYESVADLATDLRRHLKNEPVLAGPPSQLYRLRKFVARHRAGVVISVLLMLAILGGGIGVTVALFYKNRAEGRARRDAEIARRTSQFLMSVFDGANIWSVGGEPPTLLEVTERAGQDLLSDTELDPEIRAALMRDVGRVFVTQGKLEQARPLLEGSVELYRQDPGLSRVRYGRALMRLAQLESSDRHLDRAVELALEAERSIIAGGAAGAPVQGVATSVLGGIQLDAGKHTEAELTLTRAVESLRRHPDYHLQLANALINLAKCTPDAEQAEGFAREATVLYAGALPPGHPEHAEGPKFIAQQRYSAGDLAGAAEAQGQAVDAMLEVLSPAHWSAVWEIRMHAGYLLFAHKTGEARETLMRSVDAIDRDRGAADPNLGGLLNDLAFVEQVAGQPEIAERHARRSVEVLDLLVGREHPDTAISLHTLGDVLCDLDDYVGGLQMYDETLRVRHAISDFEQDGFAPILFEAYARAYRRQDDLPQAEAAIERSIELYEHFGFDPRSTQRAKMAAATIRARRGDSQGAREDYSVAWSAMNELPGAGSMYDFREIVLHQAVMGSADELKAAVREALAVGIDSRFLLAEPELRLRVREEPSIEALLTPP